MEKTLNFSPEQNDSIDAREGNYLISAGAGSGKTAVLTQRIYKLAKEKNTLDCFLVMTFTNLAAAQMKEKVRKLLLEDSETKHLATEVDSAHIETFDAFNLFLVKKYFYLLGISKNISLVQNEILNIKRKNYLDEMFLEKVRAGDEKLLALLRTYSVKDNSEIKQLVIDLIKLADSKIDKYGYINSLKDEYFTDKYLNNLIDSFFENSMKEIKSARNRVSELENAEDAGNIEEYIDNLLACNTYDELYEYASAKSKSEKSFPNKKGGKTSDVDIRDDIKGTITNIFAKMNATKEEFVEGIKATKPYAEEVVALALELENKIDEYKNERNVYTFSDLSRMTCKLLNIKDINEELKNQFDFIMIDEYQDTNDIQEYVVNSIARNNVYMVGDIKQSIYKFRNADCTIFNDKFNRYKVEDGGEEIDLNLSFRSRNEIVLFINDAFSKIMTLKNNPIDYQNGHEFGYGNKRDYDNAPSDTDFSVNEYRYEANSSGENIKKEAEIVVNDIIHKYNSGFKIFDKSAPDKYRPCDFKDFCIIVDREKDFGEYVREFADAKIPLNVIGKEDIKECEAFIVIKNLVKMLYYSLNNDYGDDYRHAFMSVARSFISDLNDAKIFEYISKHAGSKALQSQLSHNIELVKENLRYASLEEIVKTLVDKFEIYEKISKISEFFKNTHKIETLIDYAKQMDLLGFDLEAFVNYFDDLFDEDLKIEFRSKDAQANSVTLINIHQSKGLEYEIVYYVGLAKQFVRTQYNPKMFATNKYGIILPYVDNEKNPLTKLLYKTDDIYETNEEKIRVLYVALTRAKQKAIIVLPYKESDDRKNRTTANAICLKDIYLMAGLGEKYVTEYPEEREELVLRAKPAEDKVEKATLKKVNIKSKLVKKEHASKSEPVAIDENLLIFGTELHGYLEGIDFTNPDLSKIQDGRFKRYVSNVINSKFFKNLGNSQVLHEYSFKDEKNNVRGIIDCLIVKDDEIDIIDFKLKNISEDAYDKQLITYKKYISTISDKPIKMYLLAAITGEVREVKDE